MKFVGGRPLWERYASAPRDVNHGELDDSIDRTSQVIDHAPDAKPLQHIPYRIELISHDMPLIKQPDQSLYIEFNRL